MPQVTPQHLITAREQQESLNDKEWIERADQLATKQNILFLDIITFGRDGVPGEHVRALIDLLSVLQIVAEMHSADLAVPVEISEYEAATKRALEYFLSISTKDKRASERATRTWYKQVAEKTEPVLWAYSVDLMQRQKLVRAPRGQEMVTTAYAITDLFVRRFVEHSRKQRWR